MAIRSASRRPNWARTSICRVGLLAALRPRYAWRDPHFGLRSPIRAWRSFERQSYVGDACLCWHRCRLREEIGAWFDAYRATNLRHR